MSIPEEIRSIDRPVNTIILAYGKNKDKYSVIDRAGCKRINGRNVPIQGKTIGHIINGVYVPLDTKKKIFFSETQLKDWAEYVLSDKLFKDIFDELCAIYNITDALKIYCISILRVCNPGITDNELKEYYDSSFLSELYPSVALSKNTVSEFLKDLGRCCGKIQDFMKKRVNAISSDVVLLIDGTLKTNNSVINSLSEFSRKAKVKQSKDISIIYAFDLEKNEPVCSKCYPGNMLDVTAYRDFIVSNDIKSGLIVADKGFPSSSAARCFDRNPELHYLNPVKRNSKFIERHSMLDFISVLKTCEGITYKKEKVTGENKWLYSFRDSRKAAKEEQDYLQKSKQDNTYDLSEFKEKQKSFGTIVLESDLDKSAEEIYRAYSERWNIEIVMRYYKSACDFTDTRVHNDYSVIGSEFCDFLSSLLTFRLINSFDKAGLFEERNYKKIMHILKRAKKVKADEKSEWKLIKINPSQMNILEKLQIISYKKAEESPHKRKRGRPKKEDI